ncbi:Ig-like domain-containing protein [Marinobacterium rhizophilum]|uniref:Tandem-95 repeat protein n=1 Tax=Marinobacterium rhizophilum TaxID=420402 RepID=A0ABY5HIS4_9GAMM|nr:Ig-like domain-containing protein [Marinobacterium rhizophilum]UTW12190.1 tandem-95 repeat protein [Marinobacterium rhizophilum]
MRLSRPSFSQSLATTGLALALSCTTLAAFAGNDDDQATPHAVAEQARQKASDHTQALAALQKRWAKARGAEKSRALQQMIAKAEERRTFLLGLLESSPAEALRVAIPQEKQVGMPAEVQAMLEQKLELEGEYEAIYEEDFEAGTARLHQFVKTPFGERFELHSNGKNAAALTGQQVQLQGLLFPQANDADGTSGELLLDDSGILVMGATGGDNGGTAGPLPNTFGDHRVAVMLVNFQNDPGDKPWTSSQVQDVLFGQVNDLYRENSYNQASLSGNVFGWYTLPISGGTCSSDIDDYANAAATAAGVNLSSYDHLVYIMAPSSGCNLDTGTVGGSPSKSWIVSGPDFHTLAHELGHNFGLRHAHGQKCDGGAVLGTGCSHSEYGDIFDTMGSDSAHFNAFQKERLGWLGYNQSPPVTEVVADGVYTLSPMATTNSQVKGLKVLRGTDPATGARSWYYLEYRQPVGFDAGIFENTDMFSNPENLANGVLLHTAIEGDGNSSYLLDMTPDSITFNSGLDFRDAALEVGYSYQDEIAGVTITPLSSDSSGITVDISYAAGSGGTSNRAPVAVNDSATTHTATSVAIPVLANDSDPDGDSLSITSVSGVNGSAQISGGDIIFTPNSGFSGNETFNYSVSDGKGASASANVTVSVSPPDSNRAPIATGDTAATGPNSVVSIPVLANDSDPDGDHLTITAITQGSKGSVLINHDGTVTYSPARNFKNGDSFSYTISDGRLSATATVTISPESGSDTGHSGKGNGKNK